MRLAILLASVGLLSAQFFPPSGAGGNGTGLTSINGNTLATQTIDVGTSGTDFAVSNSSGTTTLNLPDASATARGALSNTDWSMFDAKLAASSAAVVGLFGSCSGAKLLGADGDCHDASGGSPGGSVNQVQYNDGVAFAGSDKALIGAAANQLGYFEAMRFKGGLRIENEVGGLQPSSVTIGNVYTAPMLNATNLSDQLTMPLAVNGQGVFIDDTILGSNIITDGDFATDPALSDWVLGDGWAWNSMTNSIDNSGGGGFLNFSPGSPVTTVGKWYRLTFTISNTSVGYLDYLMGGNAVIIDVGDNSTYIADFQANSNSDLQFLGVAGFNGSISAVSVVEIVNVSVIGPHDATFSTLKGVGTAGVVVDADGNISRGGSAGGPGGADLTLQYNNSSAFGGMSGSSWNDSTRTLTFSNSTPTPLFQLIADPLSASGNNGLAYNPNNYTYPDVSSGSGTIGAALAFNALPGGNTTDAAGVGGDGGGILHIAGFGGNGTNGRGGYGGSVGLSAGGGGNSSADSGADGGQVYLSAGPGGNGDVNGASGGQVLLGSGSGGTANSGTGGNGGDFILTSGAGGASTSGTNGNGGNISLNPGAKGGPGGLDGQVFISSTIFRHNGTLGLASCTAASLSTDLVNNGDQCMCTDCQPTGALDDTCAGSGGLWLAYKTASAVVCR